MNVLFKKGVLTDLFNNDGTIKSGITPVNGAIYFALNKSDTGEERGKLYLGEDDKLIPIGEDVVLKTVNSTSNLPTASKHKGEFYYCTSGNILAYSDGSNWVQVNTNTVLTASAQNTTVTVTNNAAEIATSVSDNGGHSSEGSIKLVGGDNVTIATATGTNAFSITAQDTLYDLTATTAGVDATNNNRSLGANINLVGSTTTASTDIVKIKSTDSVVAKVNGSGEIELTVDTNGVGSVTSAHMGGGQTTSDHDGAITGDTALQGFHIAVGSTTATFGANINPQISIKGASGAVESTTQFISSVYDSSTPTLSLDVYSTSAINTKLDNLKNTINAMTYRGSAAQLSDVTSPTGGLHNGDVFVATNEITFTSPTYSASGGDGTDGNIAKPGYLIIVEGTENDNGVIADPTTATYTIVKANDTDTTYTVSSITNGIEIEEVAGGSSNAIGSLTISEGTAISVSSTGTTSKVVTVSHATVSHTTSTVTTPATGTSTANANGSVVTTYSGLVTGVTVNSQGHVTNVTTSSIDVTDTQLKSAASSVSATGTATTGYTATVTMAIEDTAANTASASFSLQSDSLVMTASGSEIAVNLVWGTF